MAVRGGDDGPCACLVMSTLGIGFRTVLFGETGFRVDFEELYLGSIGACLLAFEVSDVCA